MSNLGPYQEFTTDAARNGGVEKHIQDIVDNALAKAAPATFAKGFATATVLAGACLFVKSKLEKRASAREEISIKATEHLKAAVAENQDRHFNSEPGSD